MRTIASLLRDRAAHVEAIAKIDADLAACGVRAIAAPVGRPRDVAPALLVALANGPLAPGEVAKVTGQSKHATYQMLHRMTKSGEVVRVRRGVYGLPGRVS